MDVFEGSEDKNFHVRRLKGERETALMNVTEDL